jgi:Na+/phosphate symporter
MTLMGGELKSLADKPGFVSFFSTFDCTPGADGRLPMASVLGAVAVGTFCTMLVQSSSATIGITIALAESGLVNVWTAVPIVLGDNIGTTVTAALAAIGTNANARRTALAHALFNIVGTVWIVATFAFVFDVRGVPAPGFYHLVDAATNGNGLAGEAPGRHVAVAHTLFNVTNVLVLSFFIPLLARTCKRLIPESREPRAIVLEPHLVNVPSLALQAAARALAGMTRRSWTVASASLYTLVGRADADEESVARAEKEIDGMQTKIRDYLVDVSKKKLTDSEAAAIPELLHCINDAERISDLAVKVWRKTARVRESRISVDAVDNIAPVIALVRALARQTVDALRTGDADPAAVAAQEAKVHAQAKAAAAALTRRLKDEGDGTRNDIASLAVLAALRDIARHLGNIAVRVPTIAAR